MRKLLITSSVITLTLIYAPTASAQTAAKTLLSREATKAAGRPIMAEASPTIVLDQRMTNIKQRSSLEIDRRINSLNGLLTKFNNLKKLPEAEKTELNKSIQDYITELTNLKTKINADTDLVTLRIDAKTIFTDFRVYAVYMPKLAELAAVERMMAAADTLTEVANRLNTRLSQLQEQGQDVAGLQTLLGDMNSKITDAQTQYEAVETEITPLSPEGYPGNKVTLQSGRNKIRLATQDLKAARDDARKILEGMKSLSGTLTATPSATQASPSAIQ
jgi:hypothetical protein